jgi:general secretion pathway protein G
MNFYLNKHRVGGFTLIEVMVVVVILGILAGVLVPKLMSRPDEARITAAKSNIRAIEGALNMYKLQNYDYPTTEQGLEALVSKPDIPPEPANWGDGYMDRMPLCIHLGLIVSQAMMISETGI